MIAVLLRARLHARGIRSETRFGEAETSDRLARLHLRQPAILLFIRAVGEDRVHHQRALHRYEAAQPRIAALDFLHDQPVFDVAQARAAVAFEIRAQESELAEFRDQLLGKAPVAIAIANHRNHAVFDELPRGLAHQQLLFREQRVDQQVVDAGETSHGLIVSRASLERTFRKCHHPLLWKEPIDPPEVFVIRNLAKAPSCVPKVKFIACDGVACL